MRLWLAGAEGEAGGRSRLGSALQPVPIVLRSKLVVLGSGAGVAPPPASLPPQEEDKPWYKFW